MKQKSWIDLQLFAEGEGTGEAPAAQSEGTPAEQSPTVDGDAQRAALNARFESHMQNLERQAQRLQTAFPGMDLRQELRNPVFSRLTSPSVGLSVEDAFYTVHRRELQSAAMEAATRQVTNAIASGARRPQENGLAGQAPVVSAFDYRNATREQRDALKRQIRQAAAQGRKIYPGR